MASGSAGAEQLQPGEEECAPDASQVINIEVDDDDDDLFSYFHVEPPSDNTNFLEIRPMEGGNLMAVQAKAKNSEFNMKEASKEDIVGFKLSDTNEWKAIVDMGAVRILDKSEADLVRKSFPHRVIASWPLPGVGNFKYKSRRCVHGHKDPDSEVLQTYSPMPHVFPNLRQSGIEGGIG